MDIYVKETFKTVAHELLKIGLEFEESSVRIEQEYGNTAKLYTQQITEKAENMPESPFDKIINEIESNIGINWENKEIQRNTTSVFDSCKAKFQNDDVLITISYMCNKTVEPDEGFFLNEAHLTINVGY